MTGHTPPPPELSVVVPVYNNAGTLDELIERVATVLDAAGISFELILVDDRSTDGSHDVMEAHARTDSRVRPLRMTRNFGGQAALCAGFDAVAGRRTVCLDADLENAPEDIPRLLDALDEGADLACGVRTRADRPWPRRLSSAVLNAWVGRRLHTRVADVGCGMRAMCSGVVADLAADGEKRRLLTPLLVERAARVVEVPLRSSPASEHRAGGHSFLSLAAIALDYFLVSARRPFVVTGLVSALVACAGIALLVAAALAANAVVLLAGVVVLCSAALGALLSLLGAYAQRAYQLGQRLPFYELEALAGTAGTARTARAAGASRREPELRSVATAGEPKSERGRE